MTGLSEDLQDTSDAQKTLVINNEPKRVNMDIATLQEICLADMDKLH